MTSPGAGSPHSSGYVLSAEVRDALASRRPIVALESTVIAHGLPRPRNLEAAISLEGVVRSHGAVPATVAVIDGVPRIGLSAQELERLATADDVHKLSTRDLPVTVARRRTGATTVAATAFLASKVGIPVFATGGIGGAHRGTPVDISADLGQLARTKILVVSAGAKSILDLPATREVLETLGVLVLGFRTDTLPAFYSRDSGLPVDARVDDPQEVAAIWRAHRESGIDAGILLCVPIPEEAALPGDQLEGIITAALRRAEEEGIRGKDITPYLLREVGRSTGGASIEANLALLVNNVSVAAAVAVRIAEG